MGYLRCHDDGPNVLLGRFVQSTLGDWRIDSVTSIAAIFHSALAFNQDLGWCLDYDVDLSADYVGGAFEKTQCASTSCGVLQGDACAPTARPTPNLTPGPTTAALTGAQVVVEIKAAVVLTGIVADDFNSEPEAQQAFSQSILAHLPRGLIDDGTEITDVVAVSIPGECDEAPTYCSNEYTGCWICMPTCSGYWSDCNAYCGSYAHCAWRRRRLQTGVEDVWSRVEVSFTIVVRQDETTATDGGASILAAVTSSLSSAVSSGAFLDTLIREAHAAGASDWLIYHIDVAVVESIISLDKATVTVVNSGSCEVCTDSIYDFVYVSCGVFELKAAKRWGDWDPHESGTDCLSNVCCARHEEDCCEANVGAITGLAVAIFVVLTMCCYVCAGCPGYPCCPDEHFCFSATRFVNNQAVHSKSVWRRCSPPNKDSILSVWRRCCPQHKGTHRNAAAPAPPGVSDAPPADDSTVVAHLQLVTGASAEAARAALAAHGNDVDAAAVALLAAVPSLPPAAKAATQNSRDAPPPYWNAIRDRNKARRFVVDPISDSEEYKRVETSFMLTLDRARFTIQSVERIQNMDLWNSYVAKRKSICGRKIPKDAQSLVRNWLFHGCSGDVTDKIVQGGFNRSFAGRNATMYGKGVYFARDASYSTYPLYSQRDANDVQSIFLARVVVGEYCLGVEDALTPAERDAATHALYDSTVDNPQNPNIFVTYNDAQAYPEYLVKFKQDGNPPSRPTTGKPAHPDYRPNVFPDCYD